MTQGCAYLYTADYYALCRDRLNPGGIMCQWVPLYELSAENIQSIIASFALGFSHTSVWQSSADIILIGSDRPIEVDLDELERRLSQPKVHRQLARIGLDDPVSFLSEFMMDESAVAEFTAGATLNTDDNLHLEFDSPLNIGKPVVAENARLIMNMRTSPASLVGDHGTQLNSMEVVRSTLERYQRSKVETVNAAIAFLHGAQALPEQRLHEILAGLSAAQAQTPEYGRVRKMLAEALTGLAGAQSAAGHPDQAAASLRQALAHDTDRSETHTLLGIAMCDLHDPAAAVEEFDAAISVSPRDALAQHNMGVALLTLQRPADALPYLRAAVELRPKDANSRRSLAVAYLNLHQPSDAVREFQTTLQLRPDDASNYESLAVAQFLSGKKSEAASTLRDGLARFPRPPRMCLRLGWLLATSTEASMRDGSQSLELAGIAVEALGPSDPQALDALAAALAENGQFDEAASTARQAADAAIRRGQAPLAQLLENRAAQYDSHRPWRE